MINDIYKISKLLGLEKIDDHYEGVVGTGAFDGVHDYDAGILKIYFYKPVDDCCAVMITTIDDGAWVGFAKDNNFDLDDLAKEFTNNFGTKLPTEKVLNDFLAKYKIYGHRDG